MVVVAVLAVVVVTMVVVVLGVPVLAFWQMLFSSILTKEQSNLSLLYNYTRDDRTSTSAFSNQGNGDDQITIFSLQVFIMGDCIHFMKPLSLSVLLLFVLLLSCCFVLYCFFKIPAHWKVCGEEGEEQGFP